MSFREALLVLFLSVALGLIVFGVSLWSVPLACIVAGVGVGALGVLFLTEVVS